MRGRQSLFTGPYKTPIFFCGDSISIESHCKLQGSSSRYVFTCGCGLMMVRSHERLMQGPPRGLPSSVKRYLAGSLLPSSAQDITDYCWLLQLFASQVSGKALQSCFWTTQNLYRLSPRRALPDSLLPNFPTSTGQQVHLVTCSLHLRFSSAMLNCLVCCSCFFR